MYTEDGIRLPGHWEICSACRGDGKSSAHLGSFSREEWDEQGYEFQEDYLNGVYDKSCEDCKGSGKVWEVDVSRCTFGQKRLLVAERRRQQWALESYRERRAEAMMLGEDF